jgi:hypothetical protein
VPEGGGAHGFGCRMPGVARRFRSGGGWVARGAKCRSAWLVCTKMIERWSLDILPYLKAGDANSNYLMRRRSR